LTISFFKNKLYLSTAKTIKGFIMFISKYWYLLLFLCLIVISCQDSNMGANAGKQSLTPKGPASLSQASKLGKAVVSSTGDTLINRTMATNSPMRNPNWDWTNNTKDTLYTTSNPGEPIIIKRPYYDASASIRPYLVGSDGTRDIWPKDGWTLLLRDFGTTNYDAPTPFFVLYNKYRGILRYFYYGNSAQTNPTYVKGTITIQNGVHSPLFTLTDSTSQTLNNYSYKQSTLSEYYSNQWNFIDFNLSGYDPNISDKYARFLIKIEGINQLSLNGIASISMNGLLGAGGSTSSQLAHSVAGGRYLYSDISKAYKDVKTAQQKYTNLLKQQSSNKQAWWRKALSEAAAAVPSGWPNHLRNLVGVVGSLIGGGSSQSRQPTPVTIIGGATFTGKLVQQYPLTNLGFIVPGAKVNNPGQAARDNELPLHNPAPGLFNLTSLPTVTATAYGDCYSSSSAIKESQTNSSSVVIPYKESSTSNSNLTPDNVPPGGNRCATFYGYITYHVSVNYVENSNIFNGNEKVQAALTYPSTDNESPTSYQNVTGDGTVSFGVEFSSLDQWYSAVKGGWKNYFAHVGIYAQLHPKDAASGVTPVSILKAYNPNYGQINNEGITYH